MPDQGKQGRTGDEKSKHRAIHGMDDVAGTHATVGKGKTGSKPGNPRRSGDLGTVVRPGNTGPAKNQ